MPELNWTVILLLAIAMWAALALPLALLIGACIHWGLGE